MAASLPDGIRCSSPSGSSVNSFLSVDHSRLTALKECAARIESVAREVKLEIVKAGILNQFKCFITQDVPSDPVIITNCGHTFERVVLQRWYQNGNNKCPACRAPVTQVVPNFLVKDHIQRELQKDPVPTHSNFQGLNRQRADQCLDMAITCMNKNYFQAALALLSTALQYTNLSADYAALPKLYDKMDEAEKADLSRLYLSLYQLKEDNIQGAVETLKKCRAVGNLSSFVVALTLHDSQSPENIEQAMICASHQKNPEERIFIYKQILGIAPDHLEAYKQLIPLIKDPKEKKELLLKAADEARGAGDVAFEAFCLTAAEPPQITTVITKESWAATPTTELPPYPPELQEFLDGDCTIWPGKKRHETHIVVPLFPEVNIDGSPVPLTLKTLDLLDKSSGGPGCRFSRYPIPDNITADAEFHYAAMTNAVIPGSRNKPYDDQIGLLPDGYEAPGVLDAARAILWEARRSGRRCFSNKPCTFTRCKEVIQGYHLVVGSFAPSSLNVFYDCGYDSKIVGVAGWRKF